MTTQKQMTVSEKKWLKGILIAIPVLIIIALLMPSEGARSEKEVRKLVETKVTLDFPKATNISYGEYEFIRGYQTASRWRTDTATQKVSLNDNSERKTCYYWLERDEGEDWKVTERRGCER